ncbi:MAG: GNAT family N-acetyltransferase [Lachnospiraceae bacterium]|nr:GNAT family N-acetyltransferase [Lachnospiraceae bacterium]
MQFCIRKVRKDDAAILAYIQTTSWKSAFKNLIGDDDLESMTNLDRVTAMYSRILNENKWNGYIGELDGKPHCMAWWDKARDDDLSQCAEIICIHSLPDNWRKGFGSKMMDTLIADILKAGFHTVILWVFTENERARRFYEAKGFVATDRVKSLLGTTEICYMKEI